MTRPYTCHRAEGKTHITLDGQLALSNLNGDIILNLIIHQYGDGLCCPSRKTVWIHRLCGNQLIRIYASAEVQ